MWSPKAGWGLAKKDPQQGKAEVYVAKGNDVRKFKTRRDSKPYGWLINVSKLATTTAAPPELVAQVDCFLRVLEAEGQCRHRDGDTF